MAWSRGKDGANAPEEAPNTVSDAKNAQLIKGIGNMSREDRERLADVAQETYSAYRRNGGSD
jgi:hypothetical protein